MTAKTIEYFKVMNKKLKEERDLMEKIIEDQNDIIIGLNGTIQKERDKNEALQEQIAFIKNFS